MQNIYTKFLSHRRILFHTEVGRRFANYPQRYVDLDDELREMVSAFIIKNNMQPILS